MADNSNPIEDGHDHTPNSAASSERERLVTQRRDRQKRLAGTDWTSRRRLLAGVFACGIIVTVAVVGPRTIFDIVGLSAGNALPKTSQVDLEVKKEIDGGPRLDFPVAGPFTIKAPTANDDVDKRLAELRKEIEEAKKGTPGVNLGDVQKLLESYNQDIVKKLDHEREQMRADNARLKEEADRLREERERQQNAAKSDAENRKKQEKIKDKQRQSTSVVIDSGALGDTASNGEINEDLSPNERFLSAAAGSEVKTSISRNLNQPSRTIVQGTIISAVLETAINTELPGNLRAQVTEPVYSFDGTRVLLPAGTLLIGTFNNQVDIEQKRVLIAWNRAVTPEGKSVSLGSTGTDLLGRGGTTGNVDNRYGKKIGAAVLMSAINALPSLLSNVGGGSNKSEGGTTINVGGGSGGGGFAQGAAQGVTGQGKGILDKYLSLPPVIRIPQGEEIRVFVNRDLIVK